MRWHWQKLTERWFPWSGRAWLHGDRWSSHVEWSLFRFAFGIGVELGRRGDDTILFSFAVPGFSLWWGISAPYGSWLDRRMPDPARECEVKVHSWAVWINPWSRQHEWRRDDPWYVRGLTFHIDDFFLGRIRRKTVELKPPERIQIELDGHTYKGTATFERSTWKRSRWFAKSRDSVWISMDPGHGLPHSGKGESGYDCGDDALCGWGHDGHSLAECIGEGIKKVLHYREWYGRPSDYGPRKVSA